MHSRSLACRTCYPTTRASATRWEYPSIRPCHGRRTRRGWHSDFPRRYHRRRPSQPRTLYSVLPLGPRELERGPYQGARTPEHPRVLWCPPWADPYTRPAGNWSATPGTNQSPLARRQPTRPHCRGLTITECAVHRRRRSSWPTHGYGCVPLLTSPGLPTKLGIPWEISTLYHAANNCGHFRSNCVAHLGDRPHSTSCLARSTHPHPLRT